MFDKKAIAIIIGKNLSRLRTEKKLSMQALANLADIEKSQIVRIEAGKVDARISTIAVLSATLDVDISELFRKI